MQLDEDMLSQDFKDRPLKASIILYNQNMDCLDPAAQRISMLLLLGTLPSVTDMRSYLQNSRDGQLESWHRILPSALGLLKWIIASNRSCIMQIGLDAESSQESQGSTAGQTSNIDPRQISGLDGWLQFRFAQGSPEHEARFREQLKMVSKPQKSLLAWHGSALKNWHSIIRQGLNFAEIHNGRAYGNGVYFSKDLNTSLSYSSGLQGAQIGYTGWPNSVLKMTQAVSLVELVNVPEQFNNTTPHFVVQNCDWIQCRYLFIRPLKSIALATQANSLQTNDEFPQDPAHKITGLHSAKLHIPRLAIDSTSAMIQNSDLVSRRRSERGHIDDPGPVLDLFSGKSLAVLPCKEAGVSTPAMPGPIQLGGPTGPDDHHMITDFQPGLLDMSSLKLLTPPLYATSSGTKMLGRELQKLQRIQETIRLQTLGWYIDFQQ
ncbi:hypothetical protein Micbo1qcDRAFT_155202, partial [Microdochium bolleyi]